MSDMLDNLAKFASLNSHVSESMSIIEEAFNQYGADRLCLSFNGGKDCTALLHLVHCVAIKLFNANKSISSKSSFKLKIFYVELPNRFDEEHRFISECIERYNLQIVKYTRSSIKEALFNLKKDYPSMSAIFIGTRSVDLKPSQALGTFQQTDVGWPEFVRINPILNWTYHQVWDFLLGLGLPYCDLYREGYSSLGTSKDTCKNSSLLVKDNNGKEYYLPAWKLDQPEGERHSRISN